MMDQEEDVHKFDFQLPYLHILFFSFCTEYFSSLSHTHNDIKKWVTCSYMEQFFFDFQEDLKKFMLAPMKLKDLSWPDIIASNQ